MTEAYLTLDLGTTRLKAALFDVRGRLLAQVSKRHTEYSQDNRQWQSADEWWHHACESIRQLLNPDIHQQPRLHIRACALSGRAGAAVFIHQTGEVVMHPWLDHRHASYLDDLQSHLHRPAPLYAATMAAKINWLKHQAPEIAREVSHALYAKDLLLYRLTGATVTDPASGPDALRWPAEILDSLGKEARLLPDVAEPWDIVGHVSATASSLTGLPKGTPVALGAHDGICANIGIGVITPGQYAITLGTHGVVRTLSREVPSGAHRFYGFPTSGHVLGGNALMSGRTLDWFVDNWTDSDEQERQQVFARLDQQARNIAPGSEGIRFFPYLAGEIAPDRRRGARGLFSGLSIRHQREQMFRAVLEGSAFAITRVWHQVRGWGQAPTYVGLTGGGVKNNTWVSILTHLLQQPLHLSDGAAEGRGGAICAAMASGDYSSLEEAVHQMVNTVTVSEPDAQLIPVYAKLLDQWSSADERSRGFDKPTTDVP